MIKRLILLSIITIIMVAGIVQVRSIDRIHASTNPLSSAHNVIREGISQDEFSPSEGEVVGILTIPRLNSEMPIIEGDKKAGRGISHKVNSSFPGENGSIILDVLDNSIIKRASEIRIGDEIVINLAYGSFSYQIIEKYTLVDYKYSQTDTELLVLTIPDENFKILAEKVKETN